MIIKRPRVHIFESWFSDFLAGIGSVFDISGSGRWYPISEHDFQPTEFFRVKREAPPLASRSFQADRDALAKDWEKVGNDMRKAMNEYRVSVGSHETQGTQ